MRGGWGGGGGSGGRGEEGGGSLPVAVTMSGAPTDGPQGEEREATLHHRTAQRETALCRA